MNKIIGLHLTLKNINKMPEHFIDPMEEIVLSLQKKNKELEKNLSDTKANLQRAYDGIQHYKDKWKKVLELNASLQKQLLDETETP